MKNFVHYVPTTGEIFAFGFAPDDAAETQAQKDCALLVVNDFGNWKGTHYVAGNPPALAARPAMTPNISATSVQANGADAITITDLPDPATVAVTGPHSASGEVTGGTLELSFDAPGDYLVHIEAFPHLPYEVTIHAT